MNLIKQLREKAAKAAQRMNELLTLATTEARDLTEAEQKEFDQCENTVEKATQDADRLAKAENAQKKFEEISRDPETPAVIKQIAKTSATPGIKVNQRELKAMELIGVCAWATARAKHYPKESALEHLENAGFQQIADQSRETTQALRQMKAFNTLTGTTGGNTIDTPLSSEWIESLYNESAFLSGSPVEVDLSMGSLDISGGLAGASASYRGESDDIAYSEMTTRQINLEAKHLAVITAISNYNIEISPLAVASIVGDDLVMAMRLAIDSAGLRGDGQDDDPAGILSLLHATHKIAAVASAVPGKPTFAEIDAEAQRMLLLFRITNITARRPRWIMSNRTLTYLQFMRDGYGNLIYPGLSQPNKTWYDGYPVTVTEQVPSNLGDDTNETELYLHDFGHTLFGVARALRLRASEEASYIDGGSAMRSAFSRDETVIRAVGSHDFELRHDKCGVVLQGVLWGATIPEEE